ncbi:MAG TPA: AraC family transcriptional regulator [Verrucomicrobiae bacterium]
MDFLSLVDGPLDLAAPSGTQMLFEQLERIYPHQQLPCFDPNRKEYQNFSLAADREEPKLSVADWFETNGILFRLLAPFLQQAQFHDDGHARVTRQFHSVQKYISEHIRVRITLGDLARVAGLHPTYFSDRFQSLVGERPLAYLTRYRMEQAQWLLLASPMSIKEVAGEVGMVDAAYFTRVFTRFYGVSPKKYRAKKY